MQVTLDVKQVLIMLVLVALLVLLIFLIIMVKNLLPSLKKLDQLLGDANKISAVAANKTEQLDGVIDNASSKVMSLAGNSLIGKATNLGAGVGAVKSLAARVKNDDDREYLKRARERKSEISKGKTQE